MVGIKLMLRTVFLKEEELGIKVFNSLNVFNLTKNKLKTKERIKIASEISVMSRRVDMFLFNDGSVELKKCNQIYCLEHIPYNTDMLLPKKPNLMDWVLLYYEQTTAALDVSYEKITRIKLRGNGNRIMGLDEHLVCDMPFMSLRLTFLGDVDGWVVT
jgi:hypothetical protein